MLRLKNWSECPPGSFWFEETVNGVTHRAEPSPLMKQVGYEVKEWRKANNYHRATFPEALADVDAFICARQPSHCFETDRTVEQIHAAVVAGGCRGCGVRI